MLEVRGVCIIVITLPPVGAIRNMCGNSTWDWLHESIKLCDFGGTNVSGKTTRLWAFRVPGVNPCNGMKPRYKKTRMIIVR